MEPTKLDKRIKNFFKIQKQFNECKTIRIHAAGYNYKLRPWVDYDPNNIDAGNYEGSPFDLARIMDLPNKIPRLDMLPMF